MLWSGIEELINHQFLTYKHSSKVQGERFFLGAHVGYWIKQKQLRMANGLHCLANMM
jgi:hypothetical protein